MPTFLVPIDLNKNELQNARVQNLATAPGTPVSGQIYYDTVDNAAYIWDGSTWVAMAVSTEAVQDIAGGMVTGNTETGITVTYQDGDGTLDFEVGTLDVLPSPTASVSLNSQKITNLLDPTNPQDAATKAYADSLAVGLDPKGSVRVATTAAGTLASSFENGDTVDGVTLATNDRILIKDQASGLENGIYVVAASGAPVRATDADASAEVTSGMYMFVEAGTVNAGTAWVLTTLNPITLNTTALVFTQFAGPGSVSAGAGLTRTGSVIDVVGTTNRILVNADSIDISSAYVGQASITTLGTITTGVWNGTDIAVADGGTGASTAAGAKTNLGFLTAYAGNIGDGVATTINVTHSLGTEDVSVEVYDNSSNETVYANVDRIDTNTVALTFSVAPTSNQYRVVVAG